MRRIPRSVVAGLLLFVVYVALSFANDPHASLGTDTGAKVLTLRAMARGHTIDPDVGYWAERWDPDGRVQPLFDVVHLHEHWVIVTTLPMLAIGEPLFDVGGYRLALVLPMLGAVAVALAGRALAQRLGAGSRDAWAAFWLIGLASPVALYALDFWEHTVGLAAMAWAVVLLVDGGWRRALGAGALFGVAATMRTEALVYGAVAVAVAAALTLWFDRRVGRALATGVAAAAGVAVPLLANNGLERAVVGGSLRAQRAAATATGALSSGGTGRLSEAAQTALSFGATGAGAYVIGGALLLVLVYMARRRGGPAVVAAGGVGVLYVSRFADGLGFVPGLVPSTPLAVFGLAHADRRDRRSLLVIITAVLALPIVWRLQYTGGAGPQWGGRYILLSGFLLAVAGVARLDRIGPARVVGVAAAVAVTVFGLVWMSVRTHDVAAASRALNRRPEAVLISREPHLVREGGAYYGTAADRRWLTASDTSELAFAALVAHNAGAATIGVVEAEQPGMRPARSLDGFTVTGTHWVRLFSDTRLRVTSYRAS